MKTFQKFSVLHVLFVLSLATVSGAARADSSRGALAPDAAAAFRAKLEQCLVRPYGTGEAEQKILGHFRSSCADVIRDGRSALVVLPSGSEAEAGIESGWEVRLLGSEFADDGDLWDVAVWDQKGHLVVEAQRVLAFGDPLEAISLLTGARPQAMIHDPSLDEAR